MRLVCAVRRVAGISPTQTTFQLAWAALRTGLTVLFVEPWGFGLSANGAITATGAEFHTAPKTQDQWHGILTGRNNAKAKVELNQDDIVLLRMTPIPSAVLSFARLAEQRGIRVYNPPEAIALTGSKSWLANLSDVDSPETIVTSSTKSALDFAREAPRGVVVKPMNASGGAGATLLTSPNENLIRNAMRDARSSQNRYAIIQHYLAKAEEGEKRLLWLDGELVGGYLRKRGEDVFQHNLQRGGTPHPCEITAGDLKLSTQITPHLLKAGVWLAGIDVIDDQVLEVNTTNPGGAYYSDKLSGTQATQRIISHLIVTPRKTPV